MTGYTSVFVTGDLMSGVSVACLHFPQGLAYGLLASLSPVQGLYTSFFPVLFYTVFGTCQHMAFGTDSVIALVTAEVVDTQVTTKFGEHPTVFVNGTAVVNGTVVTKAEIMAYKVHVAATCTFVCGVILLLMGILRLGVMTKFQSKSFIGGFTTAAAFHIFSSQVPKALGVEIPLVKGIGKVMLLYKLVLERIEQTNIPSLIIVIICSIFIIFIKDYINAKYKHKLKVALPAELITVILATLISHFTGLHTFDVETVGDIPSGVPAPVLPDVDMIPDILFGCIEMSLLIFFLSIAMVKVCTERHEYEVDDDQELLGYGLTNMACSFFPCYPANTSPPRNMILSSMGASSTLNGAVTAGVLLLVLFVLGQLFAALPVPALSAMIFVSVKPLLLQVKTLRKIYHHNIYDFIIWVVACLSGILLDLPYGLFLGVFTSFLVVIIQNQRAQMFVLRRSEKQLFIRNRDTKISSGITIFKMYSSLYFATSDTFKRELYKQTVHPVEIRHRKFASFEIIYSDSNSSDQSNAPNSHDINEANPTFHTHVTASHTQVGTDVSSTTPHNDVNLIRCSSECEDGTRVKVIIIECSCMAYIDIQGVNTLLVVIEEYRRAGVIVLLAGCTPFVWASLNRSDFFDSVSKERVFWTLADAYQAALSLVE